MIDAWPPVPIPYRPPIEVLISDVDRLIDRVTGFDPLSAALLCLVRRELATRKERENNAEDTSSS
ncbi:hypothetical protein [Bosea sp. ASV33]|uniref:hypothetical protein n=1 Tax=Bosea sp. ASV33 TaxID=2795106 RepID=UPI0018EC41A0|nr:hypothetical protein [Bosea sp. ASV33]